MNSLQRNMAKPPVHPLGALALVTADWLATGGNFLTGMDAYWPVSVGAALAAALAIFFVERHYSAASQRAAMIKAGCALPLIVAPLPFLGSVVGLALLLWAAIRGLVQSRV